MSQNSYRILIYTIENNCAVISLAIFTKQSNFRSIPS